MMLSLQQRGCHNINLVTPTHVVPEILEALQQAITDGLHVPLVYNSGGYESVDTLKLLDGIVDIYMPDMKYADSRMGREYSGIDDYAEVNRAAVKEMHRQVGDLEIDGRGVAKRGLLVRHLVLPDGIAGTDKMAEYLAKEVSLNTYVNIMAQYHPCHRANEFPALSRAITRDEHLAAVTSALRHGLTRLDEVHYPRTARAFL
jgi:putative pyruvate formate lyase activating enzyme